MQNEETLTVQTAQSPGPICGCRAEARLLWLLAADETDWEMLGKARKWGDVTSLIDQMMADEASGLEEPQPR